MPETLLYTNSAARASEPQCNAAKTVNILAYVHLRNIHASTGAGRVARQMTEHLAERSDTNVHVLADSGDHARIVPLVKGPWEHYAYHFLESETSRQQAKWFLLNRPVAEKYWQDTQVVYCTAESYVPTKKARLAVTLHDAAYLEQGAHLSDLNFQKQRLKWKFLYRKVVRHADLFHTVSHFSAERLTHFLPETRNRIRVVHNAVTPHFFEPVTAAGSAYLHSAGLSQRPFVLVPGGLHFRKNAELILAAWPLLESMHPELTLAIVNHSNPDYRERAKAFGDSVQVLGFVSDDALRALYSAAQVVWFPSRYEGFGLPVVEAMACGAPVVASLASSLPEIAGDAAILASATQPREHVDALSSLLRDESLRQSLQLRGLERAKAFTWNKSAGQLKTHFEALL
jgi:glycosyltransferase involved in cell wall biosynthesis